MRSVLVVDDDAMTVELVRSCLAQEDCEVHHVPSGSEAAGAVDPLAPDLVILDIKLPGMDGLSACREIRRRHRVPILMLSALGEDVDRIVGLEVGADDYLAKPFNPRELLARVRAMFRRSERWGGSEQEEVLSRGPLRIDVAAHRVELWGQELHLTPIEFSLLYSLAANPGRTLTRQALLEQIWGHGFVGDERTVDAHVRRLRRKLESRDQDADYITAVRGLGYRFEG